MKAVIYKQGSVTCRYYCWLFQKLCGFFYTIYKINWSTF